MSVALNKKKSSRWGVKRWTRREFYDLSEAGRLGGSPSCLIDGKIILMPVSGPIHDFVLDVLIQYLSSVVPAAHYVRSQRGLGVGKKTDPGPDYAIVPGDHRDYLHETPAQAIFVAEVAVNSRKLDLRVKPGIYAKAGVPEYWVIDVKKRQVVVHRDPTTDTIEPRGNRYSSVTTYSEANSIAPHFAAHATTTVASLLPPVQA